MGRGKGERPYSFRRYLEKNRTQMTLICLINLMFFSYQVNQAHLRTTAGSNLFSIAFILVPRRAQGEWPVHPIFFGRRRG